VTFLILFLFRFFSVPPVVTKSASGTCIDHVLTKFPEKEVFGIRFFAAFSGRFFFNFYCIRPPAPPHVDCFVSYKDVNWVDVDFLSHQVDSGTGLRFTIFQMLTCRFCWSLVLSIICMTYAYPFDGNLYLIQGIL
jgi:hypothetical protein